ncbi:hypothetical protein ACHAXS_001686 [Conticribra weissflogii]
MESVQPEEAVAVHCNAMLVRTGTCIGAYLMKHFGLTAREAIEWMRLRQPGMVIGPLQRFLEDVKKIMWREGEELRKNWREGNGNATLANGSGNRLFVLP